MNKKLIFATVATIAAAGAVQGVYADEVQGATTTGDGASAVTTAGTGQNGTEKNEATQADKQPTAKTTNAEAGSESNNPDQSGNATQFTKDGTDIQVTNPEVEIDQSKGTGKYQGFTVEYKNVHFPDDMTINEGDKVTFNLPEEINFQTKYEFDVKNPEDAVVGKAFTNPEDRTVTTVFNDYFATHPLNKQMSLKLDAQWTDKVESGKPVNVNFNGTVVTANIGKEQVIGKDELLAKWGSQDKDDPTVINWTARVNYAKRVLNYVTIIDEMSENQKLVDNYFEIKNIESLNPWVEKGSAMDLVKSISKSEHGFEIKMDRLDHMIYLYYKTKLVNAVKDSTNPTNKIELKAENDGAVSYQKIQLVGGRGDASGENKPDPVFEIPKESPKVEIPEFEGGIPGIPEVREKPEWSGGVVPNEAPILDLPELEIPDEPVKPSPDPKRDEPKPQPKEDKPNTPAPKETPKVEEVKINNRAENHAQNTRNESEETVEAYSAPATLPNTGSDFDLPLISLGVSIATLTYVIKKRMTK